MAGSAPSDRGDQDASLRSPVPLGTRTDTEPVERALHSGALDAELSAAQAEFVMGEGELIDVYGRLRE